MAVEDVADALGRRQLVQKGDLFLAEPATRLLDQWLRNEPVLAREQLAVGVASNPPDAVDEPLQPRERLRRLFAARTDVAADEDRRVVRHLRKDCFERREVAVDVVESS